MIEDMLKALEQRLSEAETWASRRLREADPRTSLRTVGLLSCPLMNTLSQQAHPIMGREDPDRWNA